MGNNGSFMEKVYLYLPVLMCHSRTDYDDPTTIWNIRAAYFAEQVIVFALSAYFIFVVKRTGDPRRIYVPDVSTGQIMVNNVPTPEQMRYRPSTYFQHEMGEAFRQLQQNFVALMLTVMAHFVLGFRPILVLQIFSTPYYYIENRLLRKYILGLKPGFRVWGERFEGELGADRIVGTAVDEPAEGDGDVVGPGGKDAVATPGGETVPAADAPVVEKTDEAVAKPSPGGLPMPKALENALIDAWDAAEEADWGTIAAELGPFSVNTQTPAGRWTALMVACGLPQVGEQDIKTLVSDLDARVDIQDEDGWTCVHWAAQQGRAGALGAILDGIRATSTEPSAAASSVVALLLTTDNNGKTAADVARDAGLEGGVLETFLAVLNGAAGATGRGPEGAGLEELD